MSITYSYSLGRTQENRKINAITPVSNASSDSTTFVSTSGSKSVRRIRKPHPHDVLCGRGGGINSHPGNRDFRAWVRERKENYNLAHTKVEKTNVSREIVERVASRKPPGRFLQREEIEKGPGLKTSQFWVEIDDMKAMAKTSQALREGAPAIRAKAKGAHDSSDSHRKKTASSQAILDQSPTRNSGVPACEKFSRVDLEIKNPSLSQGIGSTRLRSESIDQIEPLERNSVRRRLNAPELIPTQSLSMNNANNCSQSDLSCVSMTDEEKYEKIALTSIPILHSIPIVPTPTQAYVEMRNDKEEMSHTLDRTPNLLPIPDALDPPELNSFPLPSASLSNEPLAPIFASFRSGNNHTSVGSSNQPENLPTNLLENINAAKKSLVRSHSLALSDLPEINSTDQSYLHQESILNDEYSIFNDPFENEQDDLDRFVEGSPDLSAARIVASSKNHKSLSRSLSETPCQRSTSMSLLLDNGNMCSSVKSNTMEEKKSVCFCFCDGHDGVSKELCPCNHLANSLLNGEIRL